MPRSTRKAPSRQGFDGKALRGYSFRGCLTAVDNQPSLSIVIPVGPDETEHLQLLQCLARFPVTGFPGICQIVLSGCEAAPPECAPAATEGIDCIQVTGPAGRAAQLNRGVATSSGRCLWLLHADSRPTLGAMACASAFATACDESGFPGSLGWFPLSFADDGPRLAALNAAGANLRSRIFRLPFGDQGWLLRRKTFDALGGFDEQFGRGEDLDFIRRARSAGIPLRRHKSVIATSARRYREQGWLRTTFAHLWLTLRLLLKSGRKPRNPLN